MKTAEGLGAWHNQYNTRPLEECVERAKRARLDFVIMKYGYPVYERAYAAAGIPWATERFAYVDQPKNEGNMLADAMDAGACFAVINAEEGGGWVRPGAGGGVAMDRLISTFRLRHPHVGLYACLDTRGDLLSHPYQQVALARCDGIMPMVYPGAFRPGRPPGYVGLAFHDSLDGKNFHGKPVYPVLQSYSWQHPPGETRTMGPYGINIQARRASACYPGYSFYTIHHATDAEWDAVCELKPEPKLEPKPDPLVVAEKLLLEMADRSVCVDLANHGRWPELRAELDKMEDRPE